MQAGQGALLKGIEGLQQDTRENRKRIDVVGDRLTEHIDESRIIMTRNGIA